VEAGGELEAAVDNVRLRQAIGNLLDNALRHGDGEVHVFAAQTDGIVELHVTDEGAGFPEEFLPRAFERFARADHARGRGGSGLGLAIVDAIARAHGGRCTVSTSAAGSTFTLVLPGFRPAAGARSSEAAATAEPSAIAEVAGAD
jgi:signal transduction histidine kinase